MTVPATPTYLKHVSYQGGLLGAFATLAATLLVMGNVATDDVIKLRMAEDLQFSLAMVIPDDIHDNNLLDDKITLQHMGKEVVVYRGLKDNEVTAVAYGVSRQGYSGEISLIMGVNRNAEITGVRIISHSETPGLGDRIEAEKSDWIYSFDGKSLANLPEHRWAVKKDGGEFDQFSGATITPRAVVQAVKQGLDLFKVHRNILLGTTLKQLVANATTNKNTAESKP